MLNIAICSFSIVHWVLIWLLRISALQPRYSQKSAMWLFYMSTLSSDLFLRIDNFKQAHPEPAGIFKCSVLQCVAVFGNVSQCVAVCCGVLRCDAVCCSTVQGVAVCTQRYLQTLQHTVCVLFEKKTKTIVFFSKTRLSKRSKYLWVHTKVYSIVIVHDIEYKVA